MLLFALVDANYKFIYVNVGASGRAGDAGVYHESTLKKAVMENTINLPPPACIQGLSSSRINHTITAGTWRSNTCLTRLNQFSTDRNPPRNARNQRELLTTYFNNHGSVPWQDFMIK